MEKEIKLPAISEGEETGLVNDVYVKEGDHVEAEQSIIAVESDKATVDVPVEEEGTVVSVKVKPGDEIKPGDLLIVLETNGKEKGKESRRGGDEDTSEEDASDEVEKEEESSEKAENERRQSKEEVKAADADDNKEKPEASGKEDGRDEEGPSTSEKGTELTLAADKDVPAAPLARQFARELGIDIHELTDDPQERVTREHVLNYARKLIEESRKGTNGRHERGDGEIVLPDFSKWGKTERKPMSGIRRETAKATLQSWKNIPHVTHFDKADITGLESFRKKYNEKSEEKITVTSIVLKVIGEALKEFPKFNASLDLTEKEVIYKEYYHVGVAVDTKNGLLLPVIRDVNKKSVSGLSSELAIMAEKAREGKLESDDMKGGNFVISNLGGIGGTSFTPVIFPPQTAILGISRSEVKPVYDGHEFEPKLILPLSLSYDHRIIDGADAARFLKWVCDVLEQPINLIMD